LKKLKKLLKKLDQKSINIFWIESSYKVKFHTSTNVLGFYKRIYKRKTNDKHVLSFNKEVLNNSNFKHFREVIIHEYAHMLNRTINPYSDSHGKEWKKVMAKLGATEISATTSLFKDLKKKESDVSIKCKCGKSFISRNRATRMENGTKYFCKICFSKLKFSKI